MGTDGFFDRSDPDGVPIGAVFMTNSNPARCRYGRCPFDHAATSARPATQDPNIAARLLICDVAPVLQRSGEADGLWMATVEEASRCEAAGRGG